MAVFALVHGGQQGAWFFEPLIGELRRRGHRSVAVDLPAGDLSAGAATYADVVAGSLEGVDEDVIVVGHSLGGLTVPLVAQRRAVSRLAFVCAAIPIPGTSLESVIAGTAVSAEPETNLLADDDVAWHLSPREQARELFFGDCTPEIQEWALDRQRAQAERPHREMTPLRRWPAVPAAVVNGIQDRCISLTRARTTALQVFGEPPVEIDAGHVPFLTAPGLIADGLSGLAAGADGAWPLLRAVPRFTGALVADNQGGQIDVG